MESIKQIRKIIEEEKEYVKVSINTQVAPETIKNMLKVEVESVSTLVQAISYRRDERLLQQDDAKELLIDVITRMVARPTVIKTFPEARKSVKKIKDNFYKYCYSVFNCR